MIYYDTIPTPVGHLLVTGDGDHVTGIYLENHKGGPKVESTWIREPARFEALKTQVDEYFNGGRRTFDLPLRLNGTDFQRRVWDLLQEIPYGQTVTYGELAHKLKAPSASRAVGSAVGRNPISIVVPCHRVLGSKGTITGYAGGIERKRVLLDMESGWR